jgi:serine/threonine protein kinase
MMPDHPETIGRYRIVKLLGSGAMGRVYRAEDPRLGRSVALKVVAVDPRIQTGARGDFLARFTEEARASARLNHPSIVQVFDAGEENGEPWIAFQLVEGETLETILSRRGRLTMRRAVLFTADIASALQHAHGWNIIHRDVKPANILVEPKSGIAMLADFGIAQARWSTAPEDGAAVGSPGYMSPEQIDGKEVDQQSDLFSLGIVLYQMVSGKNPFLKSTIEATMNATCRGDYTPLRELAPDVPRPLDAAVRRCLFVNLKMRMRSAAELVDILRPLAPEGAAGDAGGSRAPITRVFLESRATAPEASTVLGKFFFKLKIMRWYSTAADAVNKRFAYLVGRTDLFKGESLEEATGMVRSWVRRAGRWARNNKLYLYLMKKLKK